ncbi:MAG: hypothetical protein SNH79_05660 [Rikenellaceae bacterium]
MEFKRLHKYLCVAMLALFTTVGTLSAQTTKITSTQSDEVEGTSEIDLMMQQQMERKAREARERGELPESERKAMELDEDQTINIDATIFVLHEPIYPKKIHFSRRIPLIASVEFGPSGNQFSHYIGLTDETGYGIAKSWTTYSIGFRVGTWFSARSGLDLAYRSMMSTGVSNYEEGMWSAVRPYLTSHVIETNYMFHLNNFATRSLKLHTFSFTGMVGLQLGFNGTLSDYSTTNTAGFNLGVRMAYSPKAFPASIYVEPRVGGRFYFPGDHGFEKPAYAIEPSIRAGVSVYLFGAPFETREKMDSVRSTIAESHTGKGSSLLAFSLMSGVEGFLNAMSVDYVSSFSFYERAAITTQLKKTRSYVEAGVSYYKMPFAGMVQRDQLWYDNYLKLMPSYGIDARYRFSAKPKNPYSTNGFNRRSEIALSAGGEARMGAGAMTYGGLLAARASFEFVDDLGISIFVEPKVSALLCSGLQAVMGSNPLALATSVSFGLDFKLGSFSKAAKKKEIVVSE